MFGKHGNSEVGAWVAFGRQCRVKNSFTNGRSNRNGQVYKNDAQAQKRKMSPAQRLGQHRVKSEQTISRLHRWLNSQLDDHELDLYL